MGCRKAVFIFRLDLYHVLLYFSFLSLSAGSFEISAQLLLYELVLGGFGGSEALMEPLVEELIIIEGLFSHTLGQNGRLFLISHMCLRPFVEAGRFGLFFLICISFGFIENGVFVRFLA